MQHGEFIRRLNVLPGHATSPVSLQCYTHYSSARRTVGTIGYTLPDKQP
jgi:hypothetical protein